MHFSPPFVVCLLVCVVYNVFVFSSLFDFYAISLGLIIILFRFVYPSSGAIKTWKHKLRDCIRLYGEGFYDLDLPFFCGKSTLPLGSVFNTCLVSEKTTFFLLILLWWMFSKTRKIFDALKIFDSIVLKLCVSLLVSATAWPTGV